MRRITTQAPENYAPTSGPLREVLINHAYQRFNSFFWTYAFIRTVKKALGRNGIAFTVNQIIREAATHQAATGRRDHSKHTSFFDKADKQILDAPATSFSSLDAAHVSNIGVLPDFLTAGRSLGAPYDTICNNIEAFIGNTYQLPQSINIGPDRIVDKFHYKYTKLFIEDDQHILQDAMERYRKFLLESLRAYRSEIKGIYGLLACLEPYEDFLTQVFPHSDVDIRINIRRELSTLGIEEAHINEVVVI